MVQTVEITEPRNLSEAEHRAATQARVNQRQRDLGFAVTQPAETYRSPEAEPPTEVVQLSDDTVQVLDDAGQKAWSDRVIRQNVQAFQTAAARAAPAVPVAGQAPAPGDLRAALANAILAANEALLVAEQANAAVAHATRAMSEADAAVGEFHDLDERISVFTIDALRARRSTALPPEMLTAQRLRAEAVDSSHNLHLAHGQLVSEAQAARVAVEHATAKRNEACAAIMAATADALATQLQEADRHAATLRNTLLGIGDTWVQIGNGQSRSIGLSQHARAVLLADRPAPELDRTQMVALRDWYVRLQSDPNSEFQS